MRHPIGGSVCILLTIVVALSSLAVGAQECVLPDNVNWVVDQSCEITDEQIASRNVSVQDGAVLSITGSGILTVDTRLSRINVAPDARIDIAPGGRIQSNQIGPLLVRGTDGGTFGYFLKNVGGQVLESYNSGLSFHPSSAIKTLYMIEALRLVNQDIFNPQPLINLGTLVTVCPTTINAGGNQSCPNSFINATGGGNNDGGNCTLDAITTDNCGGQMLTFGLGVSICAMMKVSNNPTTNAIQELVGNGDPETGWNNMLNNAGNAIGLSAATTFDNRMGCGGPINDPNNQTTLQDLGLLYEQMATNPNVLSLGPMVPSGAFVFANTNAYLFMDNHTTPSELYMADDPATAVAVAVNPVVNEQAGEIGLSGSTTTSFRNAIRLVHKTGFNPGNGTRAFPFFATIGGWISLPINGGAASRDYVYGVFINDLDANNLNTGNDLRDEAAELLRGVIRDALEDF